MKRRTVRRMAVVIALLMLLAAAVLPVLSLDAFHPHGGSQGLQAAGLVVLQQEERLCVLAVSEDSTADRAGIRPGDVILHADGAMLTGVEQLEALMDARTPILLELQRDDTVLHVTLEVK